MFERTLTRLITRLNLFIKERNFMLTFDL
ncbi:hypothetical protein Newbould305_2748 [Staphylococcus aureus subsp. aureus str. Newbould 305]|nr:hypothetical protein Newbould305_2748 [Staphylococcus aureus subsp. aureus str. Newbould 305]